MIVEKNNNIVLNYTYEWRNRSTNVESKNNHINKYKDQLGWYAELYQFKET